MRVTTLILFFLLSTGAFASQCHFLALLSRFVEGQGAMSMGQLEKYIESGAIDNPVKFAGPHVEALDREVFGSAFEEFSGMDPETKRQQAISLLSRMNSTEERRKEVAEDTNFIVHPFILRNSIAPNTNRAIDASFLSKRGKWYALFTKYPNGKRGSSYYVDLNKGSEKLYAEKLVKYSGRPQFLELSDGRVFLSYFKVNEKGFLVIEVRDLESGDIQFSIKEREPIAMKHSLLESSDRSSTTKSPPLFQKEDGSVHLIVFTAGWANSVSLETSEVTRVRLWEPEPAFLQSRDSRRVYSFGKRVEGDKSNFYIRDLSLNGENVIFQRPVGSIRSAKLRETEDGNLFLAIPDVTNTNRDLAHKLTVFDVFGNSMAETEVPAENEAKGWLTGPGNALWHYWAGREANQDRVSYLDVKTNTPGFVQISHPIVGDVFSEPLPDGNSLFAITPEGENIALYNTSENRLVLTHLLPSKQSTLEAVGKTPEGKILGLLSTKDRQSFVQDLATVQLYGPVPGGRK